jgi:NitT/TauT family transport system substrate-binding protein
MKRTRTGLLLALLVLIGLLAGCGDDDDSAAGTGAGEVTLRLGYFPNVTHAPAIVGVERDLFAKALGRDVKLETQTFNAGPEAVEALLAEGLDASYIGPNPAINAFAQSNGEAIRIIGGSTSGGAALVVSQDIDRAEDLRGKRLASPSLGNTQDVALRAWLADEGLETTTSGGGDVEIVLQENADTLTTFQAGDIAGAWVPEPWATRLIQEGDGKVLVEERDLWPDGEFVTTHLIVRTAFLDENPQVVRDLLSGHLDAVEYVNESSEEAKQVTNDGIAALTDRPLPEQVIDAAWENLTFTADPIASSLAKSAEDAQEQELLDPVELDGIYDLGPLNELLEERGDEPVQGL